LSRNGSKGCLSARRGADSALPRSRPGGTGWCAVPSSLVHVPRTSLALSGRGLGRYGRNVYAFWCGPVASRGGLVAWPQRFWGVFTICGPSGRGQGVG
jgi:hypothetical protein